MQTSLKKSSEGIFDSVYLGMRRFTGEKMTREEVLRLYDEFLRVIGPLRREYKFHYDNEPKDELGVSRQKMRQISAVLIELQNKSYRDLFYGPGEKLRGDLIAFCRKDVEDAVFTRAFAWQSLNNFSLS